MNFITKPIERTRFLRFALVGMIGALVDFFFFNLLSGTFGVAAVLASVLSFLAALTSNFYLNRYWTYPDSRTKNLRSQMAQYGLVNLIGLAIRTPVFVFADNRFTRLLSTSGPSLPLDPAVMSHNLALATAITIVLFWNFFINRYWTYSDVK